MMLLHLQLMLPPLTPLLRTLLLHRQMPHLLKLPRQTPLRLMLPLRLQMLHLLMPPQPKPLLRTLLLLKPLR
jgi:hypothetical protein